MAMDFIKKYWREIGLVIGLIFILMYFFDPKTEEVEVPFKIEVPVPVIEKEFDTIYKPEPYIVEKKVIDSVYYKKYIALKNQREKDSLFKEVIKINEYNTTFENDTVTVSIYSKTRGKLLEQNAKFKTKPYTLPLDTVLKFKIPTQNKFFYGVSVGMPVLNKLDINVDPILKGDLYWKTKGDVLINLSIDTQGRFWAGGAWKF
jgi:hypothetical protein